VVDRCIQSEPVPGQVNHADLSLIVSPSEYPSGITIETAITAINTTTINDHETPIVHPSWYFNVRMGHWRIRIRRRTVYSHFIVYGHRSFSDEVYSRSGMTCETMPAVISL
jgi:hypothetical protein